MLYGHLEISSVVTIWFNQGASLVRCPARELRHV